MWDYGSVDLGQSQNDVPSNKLLELQGLTWRVT